MHRMLPSSPMNQPDRPIFLGPVPYNAILFNTKVMISEHPPQPLTNPLLRGSLLWMGFVCTAALPTSKRALTVSGDPLPVPAPVLGDARTSLPHPHIPLDRKIIL